MAETTRRKGALTAEEHKQLLVHHMTKLRTKRAEVNDFREPLKTAQEEFTALVNEAKADLGKGYTRKYLTSLLEDATSRLRNLLAEEERRAKDREALGLPVYGIQADLFGEATAKMPDEAKDEIHYEAEGYIRGRNGLLQIIPDGTPPRFHQAVQRGYERGQKATQDDFLAGQELKNRQAEPDAGAEAKDLNGAGEGEEFDAEAEARKLKKSGFMEVTAPEEPAAFEAPKTGSKPRAAKARTPEPVH